jgi:hypothetical protein
VALVLPSAVRVVAGIVVTDSVLGAALDDGLVAASWAGSFETPAGGTAVPAPAVAPWVAESRCGVAELARCVVEFGCWAAVPGAAVDVTPATLPATTAAPAMLVTTAVLAPRATPLARTGRLVAGDVTMTGSCPTKLAGPSARRSLGIDTARKARAMTGSNWVPAHRMTSCNAAVRVMALL